MLDRLAAAHGDSRDNEPEFIAHAAADRFCFARTASVFIVPGRTWHTAWIGPFNGRFRDELLNGWTG